MNRVDFAWSDGESGLASYQMGLGRIRFFWREEADLPLSLTDQVVIPLPAIAYLSTT